MVFLLFLRFLFYRLEAKLSAALNSFPYPLPITPDTSFYRYTLAVVVVIPSSNCAARITRLETVVFLCICLSSLPHHLELELTTDGNAYLRCGNFPVAKLIFGSSLLPPAKESDLHLSSEVKQSRLSVEFLGT